VACDATGSRVGARHHSVRNLILFSGVNKIVPNLEEALGRVKHYAFPLENGRSRRAYGKPSLMNKSAILAGERWPGGAH
jgi:hypothetical protein